MSVGPPLARLFAIAFRTLIDGLHDGLRARGWTDVRPSFGFVLLAARSEPVTATAVAALMGTTKQAASKLIEALEEAGYVQRTAGSRDRRHRPVELSERGRDLLAAVEDIYAELEQRWADALGRDAVETLRDNLVRVLASDDGALPPVRPT